MVGLEAYTSLFERQSIKWCSLKIGFSKRTNKMGQVRGHTTECSTESNRGLTFDNSSKQILKRS